MKKNNVERKLKGNGLMLQFVSELMGNEREIVELAVKENGYSIKYAS
jgi:hypothetical protein